jgi:phosphoinositide-3-kinase regulatory subunit 4
MELTTTTCIRCVIAELFLDGVPLFNYSQLVSYRKGEYDPEGLISRIPDVAIQDLVKHMIQKDPKKRHPASKYLLQWYVCMCACVCG